MLKYVNLFFKFTTKGTDWVQEKEWGKVNGERCPLFSIASIAIKFVFLPRENHIPRFHDN